MVLALFIGSTFTARPQNGWEHMSWMKAPTMGSGSCVIDSLIYVFGGSDANSSIVKTVLVYNTVTNKWEQKHNLLFELTNTNIGLINNKVFLAGGWRKNGSSHLTFLYDPELDTWEKKEYASEKFRGKCIVCIKQQTLSFWRIKRSTGILTCPDKKMFMYMILQPINGKNYCRE